jgi:dTDP-4-amino-4,6-dideoxygalactose transaminase
MKVPLLDLKSQLLPIRAELATAILEVLDSTQYILGSKVEELESELVNYTGARAAIGVVISADGIRCR